MKKQLLLVFILSLSLLVTLNHTISNAADQNQSVASRTPQTQIFQQGLESYQGVADTWVSRAEWGNPPQHLVNYGQNENLTLTRNGNNNPLLHFDLTTIPTNSAIFSATLSLYNTTSSALLRRIEAFQVLQAWDEGNQVASPVTSTVGAQGATGDYAILYYSSGTNVPWHARGMQAGTDYLETPVDSVDVVGTGWYTWNVTSLVNAWVRGEQPNYGLVLRDITGYQSGNNDNRVFRSSQHNADSSLRPKLTISFDPDVPYADAGPDQEMLDWDGNPVTLDGSASHDRPGGNDATLSYAWRVVQPAYGSTISGTLPGTAAVIPFTADVAGEWEIELTVTNELGASATDRVHLRLLGISASHPRLYVTPDKLAILQARAVPTNTKWTQLQNYADAYSSSYSMHADALVGLVTGQASYCDEAIASAQTIIDGGGSGSTTAGNIALVYDWCYPQLSGAQRTAFIDYFNTWGDDQIDTPFSADVPGWGNYWPRYGYSFGMIGLASYGDNPRAQEWFDQFRQNRYGEVDLALLDRIAAGGAWPEGMIYDWIANETRTKVVEAWRTATGENLFESTDWFRQRLGYFLLHRWPGTASDWGEIYHPYLSTGDTERNRSAIGNYERIMGLILIERFPDEMLAQQLQAYLAAPPTGNSQRFRYAEEFLWYNPDQASQTPGQQTHYAAGTGTILMRSGWSDGAADTDPSATYLSFQCGDHFSYHQHYDQNSFALFKYDDLALDSGVYSGDGLSYHDRNYYVRAIAHNTLVVYNPAEDFSSARPDASSNDGGQRSMTPASRAPSTVEYFDRYRTQYETGDIIYFEDTPSYTYALGDATAAYNNPSYNQTLDTSLSGNVAKVNNFQREFVYLRPAAGGERDYVVLFDRVGVVDPAFSGQNTKLLFHTLTEPAVNGTPQAISPGETLYADADLATAVSGDGKLFIKPLLPENRNLRVVGGRGEKAFWVFDENYDWHWSAAESQPRPITEYDPIPYGEWRIELEPADTALDHNFLTVLHPTISTTVSMPEAVTVSGSGLSGVHITDPGRNRLALFSSANDSSPPAGTLSYSYAPTTHTLHLIFDLTPNAYYQLETEQDGSVHTVTLTPTGSPDNAIQVSSQGVLSFETIVGALLSFHGRPADEAIHLNWEVTGTLPATTTWQIDYYTQTSSIYTATNALSTTRSAVLTDNVVNYQWYTVTLHAMLDDIAWLSDTVRVMPTDRFVYLPLVMRGY